MIELVYRMRGALVLTLLLVVGCQQPRDINTIYGRRRGEGTRSVNGTAVLAHMFSQSGADVSTWRRLSPKLQNEDVIVWVPDDSSAPSVEAVDYFTEWLSNEPGRTLIFVGRDYDAAIDYWEHILKTAPPAQRIEIRRKLAQRRAQHTALRAAAGREAHDHELSSR